MDSIALGVRWNPETGSTGAAESYDLRSHITMIAPTGSGKGVTIEIPNGLLGLRRMSGLFIDPSGQNAAVCAEARRRMGHETIMLNPFNLHVGRYPDLRDVGFNPLATLDPKSPDFMKELMALGESSISVEGDSQKHFPESARGLMAWLMGLVRLVEGDRANLGTVRDMLTGDLRAAAQAAVATGHPGLKSLAYKYTEEISRELASVISTAETQTKWLLDIPMRQSLSCRNSFDFASLKNRKIFCSLILPAGTELELHGVWLRMVVTCALNALYRSGDAGKVPVLFMLSEFAQLGKVAPIRAAFGQARKYGIRLFPVLQNWGQLVDLYGPSGAWTFIANSGCLIGFNPGMDTETAEFYSKMSDERGAVMANASPDPQAPGGVRAGFGEGSERVWPPGKIRQLPDFHALVWKAGVSQPQPVYCPPHWDIAACRRVARRDPYHS
jgi:type IV secretion system protein VirD4